ncbi:hypothetical protein EKK58_04690 [Candidatus Dependentiae bacterium]|nr:MAG: hypothetical protein EKK58_04690 [Candidatus Dependentiae bacterium]
MEKKKIRKAFAAFIVCFLMGTYCATPVCNNPTTDQLVNQVLNADNWLLDAADQLYTSEDFTKLEIESLYNANNANAWLKLQTVFGNVAIKKVCRPLTDIHSILARQAAIKTLVTNQAVYKDIEQQLDIIAQNQDLLLGYWEKDEYASYDQLYFTQPKKLFDYVPLPDVAKKLNNNAYVLEGSILQNFGTSFMHIFKKGMISSLFTTYLNYMGNLGVVLPTINVLKSAIGEILTNIVKEPFNLVDPRVTKQDEIDQYIDGITPCISAKIFADPSYTFGDKLGFLSNGFTTNINHNQQSVTLLSKNIYVAYLLSIGFTLWQSQMLYSYYKSIYNNNIVVAYKKMNSLHEQMVKISTIFKAIEHIEKVVDQSFGTDFNMQCLEKKAKYSKKYNLLIALLKASTFDKAGTVWYRRGNVLLAHKLMGQVKQELQTRLRNIGLVDSYMSVARFIQKAQTKNLPVTFVEFATEDQPVAFQATQLWCPVLNNDNQYVCNDLCLGNDKARALILTGPNGCGKSTILRSMGVAAWVAQSFGIIPAEKASVSLFHKICMSVPNGDSAHKGLSTYMSAAKQGQELMAHMAKLSQNKKGLILCSEPYRGTPDVQTDRKIIEFCKTIMPNQHFIMALETHVVGPTNLEKEYPMVFVNGQMDVMQNADGTFTRTFKLQHGPALWWFNDKAKSSAFVDWVSTLSNTYGNSQAN